MEWIVRGEFVDNAKNMRHDSARNHRPKVIAAADKLITNGDSIQGSGRATSSSQMSYSEDEQAKWISETFLRDAAYHEQIDSTNDEGKRLARELSSDRLPYLVIADRQNRGRGQGAKSWYSNQHSLTFSVVLAQPKRVDQQAPPLSLFVGLELCVALRESIQHPDRALVQESIPQVKWPNDILIGGRKVCGILVESTADPESRCVVGCGVNVNHPAEELPRDVRMQATSLRLTTDRMLDKSELLIRLIRSIELACLSYPLRSMDLAERWAEVDALTGTRTKLSNSTETVSGDYVGIDASGRIQIDVDGDVRSFASGTIEVL